MDKSCKIGAMYIATLKALALIHQHSHWTTNGTPFYGDHLLFMRLYEDTLETLDLAAEKFIGLFGDKCLDYDLQADLLHKIMQRYSKFEGSPHEMSLAAEKDFLNFSKEAYNALEDDGAMTLGLDDMLMAIASKHEEFCYLLQQALGGSD